MSVAGDGIGQREVGRVDFEIGMKDRERSEGGITVKPSRVLVTQSPYNWCIASDRTVPRSVQQISEMVRLEGRREVDSPCIDFSERCRDYAASTVIIV